MAALDLKQKCDEISNMSTEQLQSFGASVDSSFLDKEQKVLLYRAMEDRFLDLRTIENCEYTTVVMSEIKSGET